MQAGLLRPASKDFDMTLQRLRGFALAATLLAISGHSFAQFGGGGGGGMGAGGRRGARPDTTAAPRNGDALTTPATTASKIRDALYNLRLQLMITPEQSKAWDRFSDIVWDQSAHGSFFAMPGEEQTVVQVVQQRMAQAQDRAQRLKTLGDALGALYDQLTPEQRHLADQNLPAVIP